MTRLSIIVPTLNEAAQLPQALAALRALRAAGHEVIVADGGSVDGTVEVARPLVDRLVEGSRGRATQMNAGAAVASGDVLVFLHADTRLPADAAPMITEGLRRRERHWGRFDVRLSGDHPLLRVVATAMNLRSRLSGIATGDQALFVERALFASVGGFPAIALMEDVALSTVLKRRGRPLCLSGRVTTSSRRWESRGVLRTIGLMWGLRLAYAFGVSPERLARIYQDS